MEERLTYKENQPDTFEDYKTALEKADPRLKELILHRAEQEADITFQQFLELCKIAYPDE